MISGALVLPLTRVGMMEASTTRSASIPCTRNAASTTAQLSVVLALYRYQGSIDNAVRQINAITDYQGHGHTCGIHTRNDDHVMALGTRTARVMVNQNLNEGAGSPRNGLPYTLSLSCGTWGGNITTENVNARLLINLTWVSRPIAPRSIIEEALFREHWDTFSQ
jgi:sulfoacetaldehyde dehydrogenase